MSFALTSVGGVLIRLSDTITDQARQDLEHSILLAWLAARKASDDGIVQLSDIVSTLQKVGWTSAAGAAVEHSSVAFDRLSTQLLTMTIPDPVIRQDFEQQIGSDTRAITAWHAVTGVSEDNPAILAYTESDGVTVNFISLFAATPTHLEALTNTPAEVAITLSTQTLVLNEEVYAGVRQSIADKVAEHLDQIVTG